MEAADPVCPVMVDCGNSEVRSGFPQLLQSGPSIFDIVDSLKRKTDPSIVRSKVEAVVYGQRCVVAELDVLVNTGRAGG
jgi:hypothetical protein